MDKTERLLDAINDPEKYSSAEIEEMLQDSEAKEIFDLLDKTRSSLQHFPIPDVDYEWERFKRKSLNTQKHGYWPTVIFSKKIAASLIIAILSFTAVAAIVGIGIITVNHRDNIISETEQRSVEDRPTLNRKDTTVTAESDPVNNFETVIFDDEPLEEIMNRIGGFYGYRIEFKNEGSKSLRLYFRWNQSSTLPDIVESLNNFEQLRMTIDGESIIIE